MQMLTISDRLLHNPWAEPPSSQDWDVTPTHTRHNPMPYYLAPLWDVHYSHVKDQQSSIKAAERATEKHQVPKELRSKLKHARAARGMLQDLEEEVRTFIRKWNEKELLLEKEGLQDAPECSASDDSEDEIVFVGRNGQMHDAPERKERLRLLREEISSHSERDGEKMVLETMNDDRAAGFGYVMLFCLREILFFLSFPLIECAVVGWSTLSLLTTDCIPGRSPLMTDEKLMLASGPL